MVDEWFVLLPDGKIQGPFPDEQVQAAVGSGKLTDAYCVRRGQAGNWLRPSQVPGLAPNGSIPQEPDSSRAGPNADASVATSTPKGPAVHRSIIDARKTQPQDALPRKESRATTTQVPPNQGRSFRTGLIVTGAVCLVALAVLVDRQWHRHLNPPPDASDTGRWNPAANRSPDGGSGGDLAADKPKAEPRNLADLPLPTATPESPAVPDKRASADAAKLQRNQARVVVLQRFVDEHRELGLWGIVKDCDAQWTAYTARIRRGEVPTYADVLSIEQLIATLNDGQYRSAKRLDRETGGDLKLYDAVIGTTAEWRVFLRILKEVEH